MTKPNKILEKQKMTKPNKILEKQNWNEKT